MAAGLRIPEAGGDVEVGVVVGHPDVRLFGRHASVDGLAHDELPGALSLPDLLAEDAVDRDGAFDADGSDGPLLLEQGALGDLRLHAGGEGPRQDEGEPCGGHLHLHEIISTSDSHRHPKYGRPWAKVALIPVQIPYQLAF